MFLRLLLLPLTLATAALSQPVTVRTQLIGESPSFIAVNAWIKNTGADTLRSLKYVWYTDWSDQGAPLVAELDWASVPGVQASVLRRNDYLAEARYDLGSLRLAPGAEVQLNTRLRLSDWSALNRGNDWSTLGLKGALAASNAYTAVFSEGARIWGYPEKRVDPRPLLPRVQVRTARMQESPSTLGLEFKIRNTGTVPVNNVVVRWISSTEGRTAPIASQVDWTDVAGLAVRTTPSAFGRVEIALDLGENILGVGQEKTVQLRMRASDWSPVTWNRDWSYSGISSTAWNDRVETAVAGFPSQGSDGDEVDSDGDGFSDVLETALGTDPLDGSEWPDVAKVRGAVIRDASAPQTVTYDFSNLPGLSTRTAAVLQVAPGAVTGLAPMVSILTSAPPVPGGGALAVSPVLEIQGSVNPGQSVDIPLPLFDHIPLDTFDASRMQVLHYKDGAWQEEAITQVRNGYVWVRLGSFSPVVVRLRQVPRVLAAGKSHALWIDAAGKVWSIGAGDRGQLGTGAIESQRLTFWRRVAGFDQVKITAVAAGEMHSLALDETGRVWAWGDNRFGECGVVPDGTPWTSAILRPRLVTDAQGNPLDGVVQIAAGDTSSYIVTVDGRALSWGANNLGQLGQGYAVQEPKNQNGMTPFVAIPTSIFGVTGPDGNLRDQIDSVLLIASGRAHGLCLRASGAIWGWGESGKYQTGYGNHLRSPTPRLSFQNAARFGADTILIGGCGPDGKSCWSQKIIVNHMNAPDRLEAAGDVSYLRAMDRRSAGAQAAHLAWGDNTLGQISAADASTSIYEALRIETFGRGMIALGPTHLLKSEKGSYTYSPATGGYWPYPVGARGGNANGQCGAQSVGQARLDWTAVTLDGTILSADEVAAGRDFSVAWDRRLNQTYLWGNGWGTAPGQVARAAQEANAGEIEILAPLPGSTIPDLLSKVPVTFRVRQGTQWVGPIDVVVAPQPCDASNLCRLSVSYPSSSGRDLKAEIWVRKGKLEISNPRLSTSSWDRSGSTPLTFDFDLPYAGPVWIYLWPLDRPDEAKGQFYLGRRAAGHVTFSWNGDHHDRVLSPTDGDYGWTVILGAEDDGDTKWYWNPVTEVGAAIYLSSARTYRGIADGGPNRYQVDLPSAGIVERAFLTHTQPWPGIRAKGSDELLPPGKQTLEVWNLPEDPQSQSTSEERIESPVTLSFRPVSNSLRILGGRCGEWRGLNTHKVDHFLSEVPQAGILADRECNAEYSIDHWVSGSQRFPQLHELQIWSVPIPASSLSLGQTRIHQVLLSNSVMESDYQWRTEELGHKTIAVVK